MRNAMKRAASCVGLTAAAIMFSCLGVARSDDVANPKIASLGDNTWLKLDTPKVHPITRSSSPYMAYAPEAGVGILWGCSHAYFHNDVWTYSLASDEWKEMLKTEPGIMTDSDVVKVKDGVRMTRGERPLSMHGWGLMDYDPDRRLLWHLGGIWQGTDNVNEAYKKLGKDIKQEGDPQKAKGKGPPLWKYDLKANKWSVVVTEDPANAIKGGTVWHIIRYFPPLKKLLMTPCMVTPNEEVSSWMAYDPDTNKWEPLKITWKPLEGKAPPYWIWGTAPIVYDSKRQALVLILSRNDLSQGGVWLLDPIKKTCEQVVAADKNLAANLDGPCGGYVYDAAAQTTLAIFANYKTYELDKTMQKRGFPIDEAHVWALDMDKKAWIMQPKPADGVLPPLNSMGMIHHYYDPVQNATVLYRGTYNGENTETWIYRYKQAKK
jgi:hypothetical protein